MLGELLRPNGSHAQGNLFLSGFLNLLLSKKPNWTFAPPDHRWIVTLENDFIDIALTHPNPRTHIIIENKWSAPDREMQLVEYWRRERVRTRLRSVPAVYLTPEGRRPRECDNLKNSQFFADLVTLSYARDIHDFLKDRMPHVRSPGFARRSVNIST